MAKKSNEWAGAYEALLESPGKNADPDQWARDRYLASLRSDAPTSWVSDHLSESRRLRGAVYLGYKVLGDQAAAARVEVYRWKPEARMGGDQDAKEPLERDHPLAQLFTRPNRHDSGGNLRRRRVQQMLTGTSLLWRVDDGLSTPRELWSVPTGTYQPVPVSARYPDGAYRITPFFPGPLGAAPSAFSQGGVIVPSAQMVACRHPHPLVPNEGLSPLSACDLEMDTIEGIGRYRYNRSRQGANPSAVATLDPTAKWPDGPELARLRAELRQLVGGPENAGRVALLGPGVTLEEWADANRMEVGWMESWSQLVGFVLSVVGVAKGMAFLDEGDASYAKLYAMLKQFDLFSLCPVLQMLADADNLQLVWPFFGDEYCIEYVPQKIDDESIVQAQNDTLLKCGGAEVDEIRKRCGLPPHPVFGKERATASFKDPAQVEAEAKAKAAGQPQEGLGTAKGPTDPAEKARPRNDQGAGSLPPRVGERAGFGGFLAPSPNGKSRLNGRY